MSTEIVALGYDGGVVMVADKRAVTRTMGRNPVLSDSSLKIFRTGTHGVIGFAGAARISFPTAASSNANEESVDIMGELHRYVTDNTIASDNELERLLQHLEGLYNKAPAAVIAADVSTVEGAGLDEGTGIECPPLYGLLLVNYNSSLNHFELSVVEGFFKRTSYSKFEILLQSQVATYETTAPTKHFVAVMGARSPKADAMNKFPPTTATQALKLCAEEILRTYLQQKDKGKHDVGKTCDAYIIDKTGVSSIVNATLDDLISGKVKPS